MSFTFGFYNAFNHDRLYDAVQISEIFDGIIRDGVYSTIGDHFVVKASENEGTVIVGSGRAWFNHTWNKNDADLLVIAPQSELLLQRYDALVIDINSNVSSRLNDIIWVQGVASLSNPQKPTLINTTEHHQYPLCYVLRKPNTEVIDAADIENTVGTEECPFVTGVLQQVNITELLSQWTAQWQNFKSTYEDSAEIWMAEQQMDFLNWSDNQKNAFASWMAGEKVDFDDWFANLHYILDGDVAGHLQNEIEELQTNSGGSIFEITTSDQSLYGQIITLYDSKDNELRSAVFDNTGHAEIKGITEIGTLKFVATDGSQTATTNINIEYFSNYQVIMAFWAATVNIITNSPGLYNKTITVSKDDIALERLTFSSTGKATYIAKSPGTYEFTVTY